MVDIVICAAQSVTRAGLSAMAKTAATEVVAQVNSLQSLDRWLQTQRADVAVVELLALGPTELRTICKIVSSFSEEHLKESSFSPGLLPSEDNLILAEERFSERLSVLGLVDDVEAITPQALLQLIGTGTVSLLPLDVSAHELRTAIAAILSGFTVFHPNVTETLSLAPDSAFNPIDTTAGSLPPSTAEALTPREIQVLNQLAGGPTNKAIAIALQISEHTVKFHISSILAKLSVTSRTEAVTVGIRAGLVML